jgi:hypothetical protein
MKCIVTSANSPSRYASERTVLPCRRSPIIETVAQVFDRVVVAAVGRRGGPHAERDDAAAITHDVAAVGDGQLPPLALVHPAVTLRLETPSHLRDRVERRRGGIDVVEQVRRLRHARRIVRWHDQSRLLVDRILMTATVVGGDERNPTCESFQTGLTEAFDQASYDKDFGSRVLAGIVVRPLLRSGRLDPRVQIVMHMDGWGAPWLKRDSYRDFIVREPVEYTGFKLFYHNDTKKGDPLMTPEDILRLHPVPLYIQYQ